LFNHNFKGGRKIMRYYQDLDEEDDDWGSDRGGRGSRDRPRDPYGLDSRDPATRERARKAMVYKETTRRPVMPPQGPMWDDIRSKHPDIPEADLVTLMTVAFDYRWFRYVEIKRAGTGGQYDEVDYVDLGGPLGKGDSPIVTNPATGERSYAALSQWVIMVGRRFYVVVNDFTGSYPQNGSVEVGTTTLRVGASELYDVDVRTLPGYSQICFVPGADDEVAKNQDPIPGAELSNEALMRLCGAELEEYECRMEEWSRKDTEMQALRIYSRAWQFRYLVCVWAGILITDAEWETTMRSALEIPSYSRDKVRPLPFPKGAPLSAEEARSKFAESDERGGRSSTSAGLEMVQIVLLIRMAYMLRGGGKLEPIPDPFNLRDPEWLAAAAYFRDFPGFRTWESRLRKL
jgi:hypothetical protein